MMLFRFRALALAAAVTAAAVGPGLAERLTEAPLVTADWLADTLGHESLVVIDVRDPEEGRDVYAAGHVPGSVSAPYGDYGWREQVGRIPGMLPPVDSIASRIGALGVDGDRHVVILSDGANSTEFGKATRVYWTFKVLGHDAVSILDGGFRAWQAAGKPVSTEATLPVTATFTPDFQPRYLAAADAVRDAIDSPVQLVDGRPEAQYRGLEKSGVARVPGTVPTAVNIPHGDLYDGTTFADSAVMARLTAAVDLDPDLPVITFCNTGHWASIAWFAISEIAGNPQTAMYDGSMADWTWAEGNPVVVLN